MLSMEAEFIRRDEANEATKKANDLITRQLVDSAVTQALVITPLERKEWPASDFDMKYFVEVMLNLFDEKNHKELRAILDGKDLRWWDDNELEINKDNKKEG
jgi:hypothetical protein